MSQETNLNVAPYFDDYNEPVIGGKDNNYYKVLFKPGYPVQARELTTLQSVLQNQVEQFGNHFFKEGAKVIPGNLTYIQNFYAVEVESNFLGIPVSLYLDQLVGTQIRGETSGVVAIIRKVITSEESERGNITLYVDYYQSNQNNLSSRDFEDGENLITDSNIAFGNTFITAGEGFSRTIASNATSIGSAFALGAGVYFIRGYFVDVDDEILILDQYTNTPSYRIGLDVIEELITADLDPNLNDNANGFNNFAAPGADRLKITARLSKKPIDEFDYPSFIELANVKDGVLRDINKNTEYNLIADEFARRTFDESGNYYIKSFTTFCKESLNDGKGNGGLYKTNQTTSSGATPSEDLLVYKIGPGKAYIKGYEVETIAPSLIDAPKTRTTNLIENQAVNFSFGSTLRLNRSSGAPSIGINTSSTISLRDERVGVSSYSVAGKEIGIARVYDFALESGSYELENQNLNRWDISLYDVQTYGDLEVNEAITLTTPTYVRGDSSGATAFLRNDVTAGVGLTVYQISGNFINGEKLVFDGTNETRVSTAFTSYGISDVKSLHANVGSSKTFTADTLQSVSSLVGNGNASLSPFSAGVSTITSPTVAFPGIVTTGNLVQFTRPEFTVKSFAKIDEVLTNSIIVSGVTTVTGVCDGGLPSATTEVNDLSVLFTELETSQNNNRIFAPLPKKNVESVDLSSSSIVVRREFDVTITNNSSNTITAPSDNVFLPFDEERYVLSRSDGTLEILTDDKFQFTTGSTELTINGLGTDDSGAKLIATLRKESVTARTKRKASVDSVIVNKSIYDYSGTGSTSKNDGLTYGNFPFGTRVQDEKISLNVPDVIKIHGIFESEDTANPVLPSITVGSLDGPTAKTDDLILGEEFVGTISGARGIYAERLDSSKVGFVYLNQNAFQEGEVVNFLESGVNGIAFGLNQGSKNVTDNYTFDNGQTPTHYGYSHIIRKQGIKEPVRQLRVIYARGFYDTADTGDVTTASSYEVFDYGKDIQTVNGIRNTDVLDARPRVNEFTVTSGSRSPFEFQGRAFTSGNHSTTHVFASDESETLSFTYFLPRLDRLYLTQDGVFQLKVGEPSDNPKLPGEVSNGLNIANIALPPYLYDVKDAEVTFVDHKRYQMSDISRLETRIKNLEYYTSLSLLENNTANLFISDSVGLNRFKSGFLIDNFSSVGVQDNTVGVKNSVDLQNGQLRASHYTTSLNLELGSDSIAGIGSTTNESQDKKYLSNILGTNIRKTGDVISLDYDDVLWIDQPFATRVENVTPYLVKTYTGSIELEPTVDVWIDVNRLELRDVRMEGSFRGVAEALRAEITDNADGSRIGVSPIIWNSWETNNIRQDLGLELSASMNSSSSTGPGGQVTQTTSIDIGGSVSLTTNLDQRRTGVRHTVREQIDTESLGDRIVSRDIIQFMRSRNIQFTGRKLKPNTQVYGFFDSVDINDFCSPKLVEIAMESGTFAVGENVIGVMPTSEQVNGVDISTLPYISFRVANSNHKYGPYNAPTDIYVQNPYDRANNVPAVYSSTSTTINIDTFSLADERTPEFWGWVRSGMILRGQSSGAVATVSSVRLVTDNIGTVIGSYMVPDGNVAGNPVFETGRTVFRLTNSSINTRIGGVVTTSAEEIFYSQGDIDNTQEVTLSLRNARVEHEDFEETRTLTASSVATANAGSTTSSSTQIQTQVVNNITNVTNVTNNITEVRQNRRDPLAQSFFVDDETGIYVTKVDVFFRTKDNTLPVYAQLREIKVGLPTLKILPFSEVEVEPSKINVSDDASVPTTIEFNSPVYLNGRTEYALVLLSDSTEYTVWISRLGEPDVTSAATEAGQVLVSSQPILGSLFKSQNASSWDASQYEDLKFRLYRASFVQSGSVQFFNPSAPTNGIDVLRKDPFDIDSKRVRIGIGTTVQDPDLTNGNTIIQLKSNATGKIVGTAGTISTLNITNAGIGYTPSSGAVTYNDLTLTNVTGTGRNGTANVTIEAGVAVAATVADGGTGYAVGDFLTVSSIGISSIGRNLRLSVSGLNGSNELILDEVQGEFTVGAGYTLTYTNNSGLTTTLNSGYSGNVTITQPVQNTFDGLHFKVNQRNHGMHSDVNQVTIIGAKSDVTPTSLSVDYSASSTSSISIASTSNFATFENISVGATNPGYARIGEEIIKYTGVSDTELTGITREIDGTKAFPYSNGSLVHKYELNGVSLLRINKTHTLSDADIAEQIGFDYYFLKADMSSGTDMTDRTGATFPKLFFNESKKTGGSNVSATYNVPFELITPSFTTITPKFTTISAAVRTVSGQSASGTETPYLDKGFQPISLNSTNYFDSPRIVASKVNEDERLDSLPGNKSFTMNMNLLSVDERLSPCVDTTKTNVIFTSNRVNNPVTDYVNDKRVNGVDNDPNAFYYVSKPVTLQNSASAIKVLLTGAISEENDIRAFYSIQNSVDDDAIYTPFPGYANLTAGSSQVVIDPTQNDGSPDVEILKNSFYDYVPSPRSFKEYEFTIDNLPSFKVFRIKLIMTSTNQAIVPVIQDLRVIALA